MAALVCAAGLGIGTATTASATTDHAASPDISNFVTYNNGTVVDDYACVSGYNYTHPTVPITGAHNNCEYRVYLYQNANLTGWSVCVNPHSPVTLDKAHQDPGTIKIGIEAYCP